MPLNLGSNTFCLRTQSEFYSLTTKGRQLLPMIYHRTSKLDKLISGFVSVQHIIHSYSSLEHKITVSSQVTLVLHAAHLIDAIITPVEKVGACYRLMVGQAVPATVVSLCLIYHGNVGVIL